MKRQIIHIDEDKCNGCGACVPACKEGALKIVDGKAKLVSDIYCDGLGGCLGGCPTGALTVEEREAEAFDENAVSEQLHRRGAAGHSERSTAESKNRLPFDVIPAFAGIQTPETLDPGSAAGMTINSKGSFAEAQDDNRDKSLPCGCPGTMAKQIERTSSPQLHSENRSELRQWPIQLRLIPVAAPYLTGADLVLLADCAAVAYANLHRDMVKDRVIAMACPKLDETDAYVQKLADMMKLHNLNSIEVVMMEVPCCGGLAAIAEKARELAGVDTWLRKSIVSIEGDLRIGEI